MQTDELPLISAMTDFYKQFYCYRKLFPKQDRHLLGARCENYIIVILESLYRAKYANRMDKRRVVDIASENLDLLKVFTRLLYELKILPESKYLILQSKLQEAGKMLGGWIRSCA